MAADLTPLRRVVVRGAADGTARIVEDGPRPHVHALPGTPGDLGPTDLWYTGAATATATDDDATDRELAVAPDPGGKLFRVVQFPPDSHLPTGDDGAPALFWHATDTVDDNVVLAGELVLLTDTGEVTLGPSDTVVLAGGRHAWSNRSEGVAVLATVVGQHLQVGARCPLVAGSPGVDRRELGHDDAPCGAGEIGGVR